MHKTKFLSFIILTLFVLAIAAVSNAAEEKAMSPSPAWKISGQMEEACRCNAACPCWFGQKPTHDTCGGGAVYFITKGNYGTVRLDGLALAQITESPTGQSMMESMGHMQFDNVYLDAKANPEQRKALEEIANHILPKMAENRKVQYVDITRKINGNEHVVSLGNVGSFSAHLMAGGFAGAPKIVNPPLADPIHKQYSQGETTKMTYTDAGKNWEFANSNYMFNNFEVDSAQYAKFEAEMAKKMEAMHKPKTQQ